MSRRVSAEVRAGRTACAHAFEPLWACAPYVGGKRFLSDIDRANTKEAARRTAFAWLAAHLKQPIAAFDDIADLDTLRSAFAIIRNATIFDVQRWADIEEARAA